MRPAFPLVLLLLAPAILPTAQAAPGECSAAAVPVPVLGSGVTIHFVVGMPVCSASASCTGCAGMTATVTAEGEGLVSVRMLSGGAGGPEVVGCADLGSCTARQPLAAVSMSFRCEGTSGDFRGLTTVPSLAVGLRITCRVE